MPTSFQNDSEYQDLLQDPNAMQAQVSAQDNANVAQAPNAFRQGAALQQAGGNQFAQGISQLTGNPNIGDPRVVQQRQISDAMKSILTSVNAASPDNENPLDKNIRLSEAISKQMMNISPAIAMKALQQSAQFQEAKNQQSLLTTQTAGVQQAQAEKARQDKVNAALGTVVFAKQGPTENGLPTGLVSVGTLDPSDPDYAQKALKIVNDAKANGDTVMPMSSKDFVNSKDTTAAVRAQATIQKAQIDAQSRLQDLIAKTQSGQMDSRSLSIAARVSNAVSEAVPTLKNITDLPIGASQGFTPLGIGSTPGKSMMQATVDSLRNKLTPQDMQRYNVMVTGLGQNLAAVESAGMLPRGSLVDSMQRVMFRPGDDNADGIMMMTKLAEARQILEKGSTTMLNNPRFPQPLKDQMSQDLASLTQAVPFTMADVTQLAKNNQKGDKTTIRDVILARQAKEAGNSPAVPQTASATEADISADMAKHNLTREQVLSAYKAKGIPPPGAP